jgi:hypothetical protein
VGRAVKDFVKTSITLARDVWEEAKIWALKKGLTLSQVVEAALRKYLEIAERERERAKEESLEGGSR